MNAKIERRKPLISKCKKIKNKKKSVYRISHFEDIKEPESIQIALPSVRRLEPNNDSYNTTFIK